MSSEFNLIEQQYNDFNSLSEHLTSKGEFSLEQSSREQFAKYLILSTASLFEVQIIESILNFIGTQKNDCIVRNFTKSQALKRKFHTLFSWEQTGKKFNASNFFKLFGDNFSEFSKSRISNLKLEDSIHNFIELGHLRNQIVHTNIVTFSVN
jgi:RiboL-PSP-HEPN